MGDMGREIGIERGLEIKRERGGYIGEASYIFIRIKREIGR